MFVIHREPKRNPTFYSRSEPGPAPAESVFCGGTGKRLTRERSRMFAGPQLLHVNIVPFSFEVTKSADNERNLLFFVERALSSLIGNDRARAEDNAITRSRNVTPNRNYHSVP